MTEKSEVPDAWKEYLDNTLKVPDEKWDENKAKKYWGQLKNIDSRPKGWLMFPAPPASAPDTFPFYNDRNESTAVPYYYNLLRSLSKESNYTGRTITEWLRHNKKPLHFYKNLDLDDTVYDNDSDDYVPSFLGRAAIVFKTDKASFIASNNDAKSLIKSIATYDTDSLEGKELMSYHNALLGEAQNVLNRIQARQSHAVNLKKQIIDREWRRFSDQNDYTYGSWDAGHQYVRSNKFLTIDRSTLRQLLNPSYNWTNDDYALFDSNIFNTITEGYREWQVWAERKKRQYLRECSEYFLEPRGFKYVNANSAVPLSMTKRVINRTDYQLKKKARMMEPVKEEPMDLELSEDEEKKEEVEVVVNPEKPVTVDISDNSTDDESVMGDDSSSGEETKQNSSTDYTETEAEDEEVMSPVKEETRAEVIERLGKLSQAQLVAKRDELEKIKAISVKDKNELTEINEALKKFETPCKNKINRRIANIKKSLKEGKWHIDENENKIVYGENNELADINEDGIKKLLITKDEKVGNEICTKDLKDFFKNRVKNLLNFIKNEKRSINERIDIEQLDKRKADILKDFNNEVKDVGGIIKFKYANRLVPLSKIADMLRYGKFGSLQNKKDLNGGYSKKDAQNALIEEYADEVRKEILKAYKKEEVIKVNGKIEFNVDGMASIDIKKGDKTYIMRILNVTMDEQKDHERWLTEFEKYTKTNQPKHLLPLHIYRRWNVEGNVATFGKTETFNKTKVMDAFKLQFDEKFVEPKESSVQKHVIYFQEKIKCTDIRGWIEGRYYALKQNSEGKVKIDAKNRKTIDRFSGELLGDETKEGNKADTMKIVKGAFEAISEFHIITPGFAHRDVKIENFCIDGDKIYLIDFDNVLGVSKSTLNKTANIPMQNGQVFKDDDQLKIPRENTDRIIPTKAKDGQILMDRYNGSTRMKALLKSNPLAADLHQAGMAMLQLGGVFDWSCDYNWPDDPQNRYRNTRSGVFTSLNATNTAYANALGQLHIIDFWRSLWEGYRLSGISKTPTSFTTKELNKKVANAKFFVEALRKTQTTSMAFNLHHSVVNEIGRKFFKTDEELVRDGFTESGILKATNLTTLQSPVITSPTQFMSTQRQPVFEKVSLESDFDDEDLEALMEFDPDVAELSDTSSPRSHISDAEFEAMLHENDNYDMLTEHIVKENKAYNKKEIEEDARSIGSSNHSNASDVSIASQISNASNASNASAVSNASNISNLSASSEKSNISDMSNHSYMSNHSLESEEHYPTSEQSYHMSEVSYNQSSDNSYNSGTDSSSGKDMDYSHGISESSDHESSNESLGYSSSGNSSQNHSYNSSSDTE